MVLHNPNNWHWVDKNCIDWTRAYFKDKLVGISAKDGSSSVEITSVKSVDGDVDVCQRKGKVISLFDLKTTLHYAGKLPGADEELDVEGDISVPEIAYDSGLDDYEFTITIANETSAKFPVKALVRQKIIPQLREAFQQFGIDLIKVHGSDIQHPDQTLASKNRVGEFSANSKTASDTSVKGTQSYNTTSLHLEPVFTAPANELYQTFIDPARVRAWTRSEPKIAPTEGSEYSLFGGNITGKIEKLVPNKTIQMSWRLRDWKPEHYAQLVLTFTEGSGETKLGVNWSGIPIGQEEVTQRNFEEYYVRSIKITFGFGAVL